MQKNMAWSLFTILGFGAICFILVPWYLSSKQNNASAQVIPTDTPSPTPISGDGSARSSNSSAPTPVPTINPVNAFAYTPLPAMRGPKWDIQQASPLMASRIQVQVDDSITFSVGIKNISGHDKDIQSLCFESSDGNFGCIFGIKLAPGEIYTASNVGTWLNPGTKRIWVMWTQDGHNYYIPIGANFLTIEVVG